MPTDSEQGYEADAGKCLSYRAFVKCPAFGGAALETYISNGFRTINYGATQFMCVQSHTQCILAHMPTL